MWESITRLILRNRLVILICIAIATALMGYKGLNVKMEYDFPQILSDYDSAIIEHRKFKELFGEDGSILIIGTDDSSILTLDKFNKWAELTERVKKVKGIDTVLSLSNIYNLKKDETNNTFRLEKVIKKLPETQTELDSLLSIIFSLPFYEDLLYVKTDTSFATLLAITFNKETLNSKARSYSVNELVTVSQRFSDETGISLHYSGMPYLRTFIMQIVLFELPLFIGLAALLLSLIIYLIFRSLKSVFISLLVVSISVIFVLGTLSLLNFHITILTGLIPALVIVIGIPNCIYFINKFHQEYAKDNNKIKAISVVIKRIGVATFLTNATTSLGFATFILTGSKILVEFGIVATINVLLIFVFSLLIIPSILSYLPAPSAKHTKHLENKILRKALEQLVKFSVNHRKIIYLIAGVVLFISVGGMLLMKTSSSILDDFPENNKGYKDLLFFEKYFKGILPIEIKIETKSETGIFGENAKTLYKIRQLEKTIKRDTSISKYMSKSLSMSDLVSFSYQAHNDGNPRFYMVPPPFELSKLQVYTKSFSEKQMRFKSFIDSTNRITRVSIQMTNLKSNQIRHIKDSLQVYINRIFPPDEYKVTITGTSIVFLEGTGYLLKNLIISILLAIIVISLLIALLFRSGNMILIYLIPNILPLLFTAGLMGYFGIAIKPSTVLIFSVAFGIAVDNSIHFLAKYRQELKFYNWSIKKSVIIALRETGSSMIYTSIVLFFGFGIFAASSFGGTKSMGILLSITLLMAVCANLTLLPSLLLSFEKRMHAKAYKDPLIQIFDEEVDIDLDLLKIPENEEDNDN